MKNDIVIGMVGIVTMIIPIVRRKMNLNITCPRDTPYPNLRIEEIRSGISVELPRVQDLYRLSANGDLGRRSVKPLRPKVLQKSLGNHNAGISQRQFVKQNLKILLITLTHRNSSLSDQNDSPFNTRNHLHVDNKRAMKTHERIWHESRLHLL